MKFSERVRRQKEALAAQLDAARHGDTASMPAIRAVARELRLIELDLVIVENAIEKSARAIR